MRTNEELRQRERELVKEGHDLVEKAKKDNERALTQEEKTSLAAIDKELAEVRLELQDRLYLDKADERWQKEAEAIALKRSTPAPEITNDGLPPREPDPDARHYKKVRSLRAFKGPQGERDAYQTGQFIRAALLGNQEARRWCEGPYADFDYRALSVGTNTAGGFLVPEAMSAAIINLREDYGVFRQYATVIPMDRDIMTIPRRAGGVTATWTAESGTLTESDPSFNQVTLFAKKLGVITRISTELAEDSIINIADWVTQEFAYAFAKMEDDCGFKGTGTAAYGSIVGASIKIVDGTHTAGALDATAGDDQYSELIAADLSVLIGLLPTYAMPGARWFGSNTCWGGAFERLMAGAGGNTTITLAGKVERAYLGYPFVITQSLPTTTAAQDAAAMLLFGDLSQAATLGDRRQITIGVSSDRYFVEDQIAIKATQRFDISVHDLGDTSSPGPIVALIGNTS